MREIAFNWFISAYKKCLYPPNIGMLQKWLSWFRCVRTCVHVWCFDLGAGIRSRLPSRRSAFCSVRLSVPLCGFGMLGNSRSRLQKRPKFQRFLNVVSVVCWESSSTALLRKSGLIMKTQHPCILVSHVIRSGRFPAVEFTLCVDKHLKWCD